MPHDQGRCAAAQDTAQQQTHAATLASAPAADSHPEGVRDVILSISTIHHRGFGKTPNMALTSITVDA
jgi:hypothetical protein